MLTAHSGWIFSLQIRPSQTYKCTIVQLFISFLFLVHTVPGWIHNKTWNICQCIIVFVVVFDMCRGETVDLWVRRCWGWKRASRKPGGRAERRFTAVVKEDMKLVGVRERDAEDRLWWRQVIGCGNPWREPWRGKNTFLLDKTYCFMFFRFCLYIELTLKECMS